MKAILFSFGFLLIVATLAMAVPSITKVEGIVWSNQNYQQKIEFVNDLFKLTSVRDLPIYISITDIDLQKHPLDQKLMVLLLDSFYLADKNYDVPIWLAILYKEGKIVDWQLDLIMERERSKEKTIEWVE